MAGTDSRQIYVCIQFCGILIRALPIVFLLFVPYGIRQMRVSRRILIPVMAAGIILAGTAEAVILYDGSCRAGEDAAACWLWGNLILLCMFSIETAAYFLAVKKEAGTRLLTWLIVLHYGTFLYAVTETVEKLLEIRVYGSGFRPWSTVSIIIYVIITAITYPFIYRLMKQHRSEHMHTSNRKKLCMVTIIPVLLLILYICSLSAEQKLYYFLKDGAGELCILIWMASMILMDIFAYHFYLRGLQTAEKQIEELERTSAMLSAAESQQYQSFSDRLGEDRRMYHNMRHHFRTMASLADRKQYDRLEDYLKRYLKEWEEIADRDICGNPMFNVILGYYFSLAEKKGIRVETDISIKEYYPFDITDMTVLLGNAMENAVEACEDSGADQPFIRIMLRQVKQSFLIKIENCMAPEGEEGMKKKFRKSPGAENGGTAGPVRRDRAGGDLTSQIIAGSFSRFIDKGVSNITYVVFDSSDQPGTLTREVRFTDYHSPRFTLTEPLVFAEEEGSYTEAMNRIGAQDMLDGDLKDWITQTETDLNYQRAGSYTMTVEVSNSFGDTSTVGLPVHVVSAERRTMDIELSTSIVYISTGGSIDPDSYVQRVTDAQGNEADAGRVKVSSNVDTQTPGVYEIHYEVSDGGSTGETWLTVIVEG